MIIKCDSANVSKVPCLTFHETFMILANLLDFQDLTWFLQEHGLVDESCIPYQDGIPDYIFKAIDAPDDELELSMNGKHYFITEKGIRELFNIALTKYLLERTSPIEH